MKKTRKKPAKKYFFKPELKESVYVVKDDFFNEITADEALYFGISSFLELKDTLMEDAVCGDDAYIGNMKVVNGLERFLVRLDEKFPGLLVQLKSLDLRNNGVRVFKC